MLRNKKRMCAIIALALSLNFISPIGQNALALSVDLDTRYIASGVEFAEKQFLAGPKSDILQRVNVIKADLQDEDNDIVFSKGKSTAMGKDTLSAQIKDVESDGYKVVGGVNADFFQMSTGASLGPHVEEGVIITGYSSKSDEKKFPIINVDANKKLSIDTLSITGTISIANEIASTLPEEIIEESDMVHNDIYTVNRYQFYKDAAFEPKDQIIILTPNYSSSRVINPMAYAPDDIFVVVELPNNGDTQLKNGGLKLGQNYMGTVVDVVKGKSVTIPENGYVIACNGNKAQWVEENIDIGRKVRVNIDFNKKEIQQAVGAYSYLVEDGQAYSHEKLSEIYKSNPNLVNQRRSRTAFGIDKDGKVVATILEGGSSSSDKSDGATLVELAEMMEELGVVTAVNLDGGGSTQMNVKEYARDINEIVNSPEGGGERNVSNAILFLSKGEKTNNVGSLKLEDTFYIYKGSEHKLDVIGEDEHFNEIDLKGKDIKWSVKGGDSLIDSNGVFKAGNTDGLVEITAECDGAKATTYAVVVDEIGDLKVNVPSVLYLDQNDTVQLDVTAKTINNQDVIIDEKSIRWALNNEVGTVDQNGLLKITAQNGIEVLTIQAGNRNMEVELRIGENFQIVEDFEKSWDVNYKVGGYVGGSGSLAYDKSYNGAQSYKISYDYSKWTNKDRNGTIDLIPTSESDKFVAATRPDKLGVMIYGDGKAPWVRAAITDATGEEFIVNLTSEEGITWSNQWKQAIADIPREAVAPITLNKIYMVETDKTIKEQTGTVYFDDVRFIYGNETRNEMIPLTTEITDVSPDNNQFIGTNKFIVSAKITDDTAKIDQSRIEVKIDGRPIPFIYDEFTGYVHAMNNIDLAAGRHTIFIKAANVNGVTSRAVVRDIIIK